MKSEIPRCRGRRRRFNLQTGERDKVRDGIAFDENLTDGTGKVWELRSLVSHIGDESEGHYVAFVKREAKWCAATRHCHWSDTAAARPAPPVPPPAPTRCPRCAHHGAARSEYALTHALPWQVLYQRRFCGRQVVCGCLEGRQKRGARTVLPGGTTKGYVTSQ